MPETRHMVLVFLFLIIINVNLIHVVAQTSEMQRIDEFIEATMVTGRVPGLGLAVVKDGQVFVTKGYGKTRLDSEAQNVTKDTLFYIASTTKAITSALISQLMHESTKYNLDTPVREIMPLFHLSELYRQEMVSVRDLLSHNTGVMDSLYNWMLGDVNTREQSIEYGRFFKSRYPLRTRTYYNNLMYTAAGLLIEHLEEFGGKTWEQAMTERIFEPLGMNDTGFMNFLTPEQESRLATAHETDWRALTLRDVEKRFFNKVHIGAPAGSVVSSANDIVKWLLALTNNGTNEQGRQVIDPEVLRATTYPVSINGPQGGRAPFNYTGETYGLGWYTGFDRGYRKCDHGGYMYGYHSLATFYPDARLAIMTLANGQRMLTNNLGTINNFIADLFLFGGSNRDAVPSTSPDIHMSHAGMLGSNSLPLDDMSELAEFERRIKDEEIGKRSENDLLEITKEGQSDRQQTELDEYTGTYGNFYAGNTTVSLNDVGRLQFIYGDFTNLSLFRFENVSADTFVGFFADPLFFFPPVLIYFGRNETGQVHNVTFPIMLPDDPTVFVRGLRMSQAPPPLDPLTCSTDSTLATTSDSMDSTPATTPGSMDSTPATTPGSMDSTPATEPSSIDSTTASMISVGTKNLVNSEIGLKLFTFVMSTFYAVYLSYYNY